ncbi:glycosyltransferase family 25 protein [Brucella tritici]|uniref:Glycosyltransferase family 25 protein n=1 Tax=Brucella tritici TaxID=94626 RepID=A0A7V8B4I2_9HYPH|nr:glycosyltransferase family 25 protein [Brucella tritici]KAB2659176.1 glycosyltransferase family 25 protein [Brucella tritici]
MKSYLINLDRSCDRLTFMTEQFCKLGCDFTRVSAVDARMFTPEQIRDALAPNQKWPHPLTPAEIGCFLSHKKCLELIAQGEEDHAAIFEDDVLFGRDADKLLASGDWIPADADIIKIETHDKIVLLGTHLPCAETHFTVARLRSRHLLSAGYIISKPAAQRMLAFMEKPSAPLDHFLFDSEFGPFSNFAVYQTYPAMCRQVGLESTIDGNRKHAKTRPALMRLLLRETIRIYRRSRLAIIGACVNRGARKRWTPIPFEAGNETV